MEMECVKCIMHSTLMEILSMDPNVPHLKLHHNVTGIIKLLYAL